MGNADNLKQWLADRGVDSHVEVSVHQLTVTPTPDCYLRSDKSAQSTPTSARFDLASAVASGGDGRQSATKPSEATREKKTLLLYRDRDDLTYIDKEKLNRAVQALHFDGFRVYTCCASSLDDKRDCYYELYGGASLPELDLIKPLDDSFFALLHKGQGLSRDQVLPLSLSDVLGMTSEQLKVTGSLFVTDDDLHEAVATGQLDLVEAYLDSHPDYDLNPNYDSYPNFLVPRDEFKLFLIEAVKSGDPSMVACLMKHGLRLELDHEYFDYRLTKALVESDDIVMLQWLLDHGWSACQMTWPVLIEVVGRRKKGWVECLIEYGADPNQKNLRGETALDVCHDLSIEQMLGPHACLGDASVDLDSFSPDQYLEAICSGNSPLLRALIARFKTMCIAPIPCEDGVIVPIVELVRMGNTALVKQLLELGADASITSDQFNPLGLALVHNNKAMVALLVDHKVVDPCVPNHSSISGDMEVYLQYRKALVGCRTNAPDRCPAICFLKDGNEQYAHLYLEEYGCDISEKDLRQLYKLYSRFIANRGFKVAAKNGYLKMLQTWLDVLVPPNLHLSDGLQWITDAVEAGHFEVAKLMIAKNAGSACHDVPYAKSPMMRAVQKGDVAVVRLLYQSGHGVTESGQDWHQAMRFAVSHRHWEVMQFLLEVYQGPSDALQPYFSNYLEKDDLWSKQSVNPSLNPRLLNAYFDTGFNPVGLRCVNAFSQSMIRAACSGMRIEMACVKDGDPVISCVRWPFFEPYLDLRLSSDQLKALIDAVHPPVMIVGDVVLTEDKINLLIRWQTLRCSVLHGSLLKSLCFVNDLQDSEFESLMDLCLDVSLDLPNSYQLGYHRCDFEPNDYCKLESRMRRLYGLKISPSVPRVKRVALGQRGVGLGGLGMPHAGFDMAGAAMTIAGRGEHRIRTQRMWVEDQGTARPFPPTRYDEVKIRHFDQSNARRKVDHSLYESLPVRMKPGHRYRLLSFDPHESEPQFDKSLPATSKLERGDDGFYYLTVSSDWRGIYRVMAPDHPPGGVKSGVWDAVEVHRKQLDGSCANRCAQMHRYLREETGYKQGEDYAFTDIDNNHIVIQMKGSDGRFYDVDLGGAPADLRSVDGERAAQGLEKLLQQVDRTQEPVSPPQSPIALPSSDHESKVIAEPSGTSMSTLLPRVASSPLAFLKPNQSSKSLSRTQWWLRAITVFLLVAALAAGLAFGGFIPFTAVLVSALLTKVYFSVALALGVTSLWSFIGSSGEAHGRLKTVARMVCLLPLLAVWLPFVGLAKAISPFVAELAAMAFGAAVGVLAMVATYVIKQEKTNADVSDDDETIHGDRQLIVSNPIPVPNRDEGILQSPFDSASHSLCESIEKWQASKEDGETVQTHAALAVCLMIDDKAGQSVRMPTLLLGDSTQLIPAVLRAAMEQAQPVNVFVLDDSRKLDHNRRTMVIEGEDRVSISKVGHLDRWIEAAKQQPERDFQLVIDWGKLPNNMRVRLNTLLDPQARLFGQCMPANLRVISVCQHMPDDLSFVSRHGRRLVAREILSPVMLKNSTDAIEIDLMAYADWRATLLGRVVFDKDGQRVYHPSPWVEFLQRGAPIRVVNAPEDAREAIGCLMAQSIARGYIEYHGYRIKLEKGIPSVWVDKRSFDFSQFKHVQISRDVWAGSQPLGTRCVNTRLFDYLLFGMVIENGHYLETDGWIKKAKIEGILSLYVSGRLSEEQWYALFKTAQIHQVILDLHVAPGVEVPKMVGRPDTSLSKQLEKQAELLVINQQVVANALTTLENGYPLIKCHAHLSTDPVKTLKAMVLDPDALVIDVEDHSIQDLLGRIDFDKNTLNQFEFKPSELLRDYLLTGKHVVLKGNFPEALLCDLHPWLLGESIEVGGQSFALKGRLDLIIESNKKPAALACFTDQQVRVSYDEDKALAQPDVWNEHVDVRMNFKSAKSDSEAFVKTRKRALKGYLKSHRYVVLIGETATGKSSLMREMDQEVDCHVHRELDAFDRWFDDRRDGTKILFVDESNLLDMHLTFLSMQGDPPRMMRNGKVYTFTEAQQDHKIVFAKNPESLGGGRVKQKLFDNVAIPEMRLVDFPPCYIYDKILREVRIHGVDDETFNRLAHDQIEVYMKKRKASGGAERYTVRALQQDMLKAQSLILENTVEAAATKMGDTLILPSLQAPYERLLDFLRLRDLKNKNALGNGLGLNGFMLEGAPGLGKSMMVQAVLEAHCPQVKWVKIDASLSIDAIKQLLSLAMHAGQIVLLEELNSLKDGELDDPELERCLNSVLTGEDPLTGAPVEMNGFALVTTTNGAHMQGRVQFSEACLARFDRVEAKGPTNEDLHAILASWGYQEADRSAIVQAWQLKPHLNMRDLVDWHQWHRAQHTHVLPSEKAASMGLGVSRGTMFGGGANHDASGPSANARGPRS